jgi:two-component system, NtrC family, sensor histidine kinase HydH
LKEIFSKPRYSAFRYGIRIAAIYAVIGFLWVAFSDLAADRIFRGSRILLTVNTLKGWFFVASSAILIYALIRRTIESIRQSEDALRESQRILSTLFSNLPGMAYRCEADVECTLQFVSDGALELTAYSPSELTSKQKLNHLILEEDREIVRREIERAVKEREPFRLVYRIRTADGKIKWVWEQGLGIYSKSGGLTAIEGFITDISERKKAEEALSRSEEIYRALVEGTSDAILMVDRNRNILSVNRAFLKLFGYSKEELGGVSVRIVHPSEESFNEFEKKAYPALEEAPLRIEWRLKKKDGTIFPVEGTYSAVFDSEGVLTGHVGIIRDITNRKKSERELTKYREHLEDMVRERTRELEAAQRTLVQREKLKTLGAIAAEVAHEIRNPLVSIGGFARRLKKKYPDAKEAEIILKEARRLEMLLDRLSEYLHPISMEPRESYVNSILSDTIDQLAPELEREKVKLHLDLNTDLPSAHVDPIILAKVFSAVIRNSLKTMDARKELTIKTYEGSHLVYVDVINATKTKVKDLELMLLPFEQNEQTTGMSSSFRLLRDMGGTLSVSEIGDEAVFTISLEKCESSKHAPLAAENE